MADSDTSADDSSRASAPPSPPPSAASSSEPSTPKSTDSKAFKSNLQVLLQRQDNELVKNLEYKKKVEDGCSEDDELREDESGEKEKRLKDENTDNDDDLVHELATKVKKPRKKSVDKGADLEGEGEEKKREKEPKRRKMSKDTDKEEKNTTPEKGKTSKVKKDHDKGENTEEQTDREDKKIPKKRENAEKPRKKSKANLQEEEEETKHSKREKEAEKRTPKKENEGEGKAKKKDSTEEKTPKKETEKRTPKKDNEGERKAKKKDSTEEKVPKKISTPEREKMEAQPKKTTEERDEKVVKKSDVKITKEAKPKDKSAKMKEEQETDEGPREPKTGKTTDNHRDKKEKAKQQDVPPQAKDTPSPKSPTSSPSRDGKERKVKEEEKKKKKQEEAEKNYEASTRKQQGILMKKGQTPFSSWKKYYFVLDGKFLMYYQSENEYRGLQGAKGSLELAALENVEVKKAGRTKSQFPFSLSRKNQKTINLATATEEERELWVSALTRVHQNQNRFSGSENILHSPPTPVATEKKEKYATMPVGTPPADCPSEDSSSESEEDSEPKEEEPEPKEEEPVLIKPKKIIGIGIGIPLDFGAVKLKKVETPKKQEEKQEKKDEPKVDNTQDPEKEENGAPIFGVKLKKPSVTENVYQKEKENKATGKTVTENEPAEVAAKRPNKQPNIPLNKSPLLSHAELDANRVSPESKRSAKTERKKSPSPSIPLSRGVQAVLVKSGEEPEDVDGGKVNELTVNIAQSKEIRYSDDLNTMEDAHSIEYVPVKNETVSQQRKDEDNRSDVFSDDKQEDITEIPQVSVTVKENSDEGLEDEESDEEFLRIVEQNRQSGLINNSASKMSSEENHKSSHPNDAVEEKLSLVKKDSCDENAGKKKSAIHKVKQENKGISEEPLKNVAVTNASSPKSKKESSAEVLTTPLLSPITLKSETNESSVFSHKSDSENTEKKFRKVKKSNSKHSNSGEDEKQEGGGKEPKTKRKKKSSFSKLLPSKKSKEKISKYSEEESVLSEPKTPKSLDSPKSDKEKQIKPEKDFRSDTQAETEQQETAEKDIPHISLQGEKEMTPVVELRHNPLAIKDEGRCSTYSRSSNTSREMDPPPSVPEKRGIRAKSPAYDTPQSNRPITSTEHAVHQPDIEPIEGEKVDGMISQEQIHAILSARDSREKRKMSIARNSGGLLAVPDSSLAISSKNETHEDMSSRRPSYQSITSTESDEPLPRTHFLSGDRLSSCSGNFKIQLKSDDSDVSDCPSKSPECPNDVEATVVLRRQPRLTDSLTDGPRVSLTSPEFTVMEEDQQETLDVEKRETPSAQKEVRKTEHLEEDEQDDYFPVIGGGVELRQPSPSRQDLSDGGMRTSGILGLKAFLEENQENCNSGKAGISRLGHSAAIEKLKRESGEDT